MKNKRIIKFKYFCVNKKQWFIDKIMPLIFDICLLLFLPITMFFILFLYLIAIIIGIEEWWSNDDTLVNSIKKYVVITTNDVFNLIKELWRHKNG